MVTKRIRSEYMKKFKDPKWETYTKCYEEMLRYRLTRRLLEHTHNPWFWSGSDTDSDSGGRSPLPPSKNQVRAETSRDRTEAKLEQCEGARMDRATAAVPRLPLQEEEEEEEEENVSALQSAAHGSQREGARETRAPEEEREEQRAGSRGSRQRTAPRREHNRERDMGGPQQSKPPTSSKQSQRVRPAPARQPREDSKDSRHPFALYGSGEKDADIAGRKTHNVGPAASTNEIHESALRAKTRREVERLIQTQRTERRRAKSADLDKARRLVQPEFNPWLTEYMRCFSARSR
ncbi:centriole, cilia and spindle-associated protein [Chaetodon trifascialis]|uniref:centriole, cilia and spindle-associated protein n=1 Tax=Chaetodon trifascialis TaxID=109706 RepID=UPI00399540BE